VFAEGKRIPDGRVLVYDTDGYFMGATAAEQLARDGREVTLVTSFAELGPYMDLTGERVYMERTLHDLGVEVVTSHILDQITPGACHGRHIRLADCDRSWEVGSVLLVTQRNSNVALFRELEASRDQFTAEGIEGLFRVGDCKVPLMVLDAVFDGHRLAREIDSADPATPLPYIREHRVLDRSLPTTTISRRS
jgi:dimethylamine/trimethylamine dehydrogenase